MTERNRPLPRVIRDKRQFEVEILDDENLRAYYADAWLQHAEVVKADRHARRTAEILHHQADNSGDTDLMDMSDRANTVAAKVSSLRVLVGDKLIVAGRELKKRGIDPDKIRWDTGRPIPQ